MGEKEGQSGVFSEQAASSQGLRLLQELQPQARCGGPLQLQDGSQVSRHRRGKPNSGVGLPGPGPQDQGLQQSVPRPEGLQRPHLDQEDEREHLPRHQGGQGVQGRGQHQGLRPGVQQTGGLPGAHQGPQQDLEQAVSRSGSRGQEQGGGGGQDRAAEASSSVHR